AVATRHEKEHLFHLVSHWESGLRAFAYLCEGGEGRFVTEKKGAEGAGARVKTGGRVCFWSGRGRIRTGRGCWLGIQSSDERGVQRDRRASRNERASVLRSGRDRRGRCRE